MPDPFDWLSGALADLESRGLRRRLTERQSPQRGDRIVVEGRELVNFGSNDYLGLACDERVVAAVRAALDSEGWGAGASPLVTGRSCLHARLERELAAFEGTEVALLFPSGYAANVGTITALAGKGDAIFSDELNHASIIDGCRLSGATIRVYRHRDLQHLAELLDQAGEFRRCLIVTDSLFSMHGGAAPLRELTELAARYGAMLMVDEAHATGVLGERGRGLCEQLAVEGGVSIRVGTLSKALGGHGGFVCGSQPLIDWLANRARPYVFSTAAPAAAAAAGLAALDIVRSEPERRFYLRERYECLQELLAAAGIPSAGAFQIVAVILKDPDRTMAVAAMLRDRGYFVPGIRPPSVPAGQSLLRISVTALHTDEQLDGLVAGLAEVVD